MIKGYKKHIIFVILFHIVFGCISNISDRDITSNVPDNGFRRYLKEMIPKAFEGNMLDINSSIVKNVEQITITTNKEIRSLDGINYFSGLKRLEIIGVPYLGEINVRGLDNLESLKCINTDVTRLLFQGNSALIDLDCSLNGFLSNLDISGLTGLRTLNCSDSSITTFRAAAGNRNLRLVNCSNNKLIKLDLSNLPNLITLNCSKNELTDLDIRASGSLSYLTIKSTERYNKLQTLSIHENIKQHKEVRDVKAIRESALKVETYNNGTLICSNYFPDLEQCEK